MAYGSIFTSLFFSGIIFLGLNSYISQQTALYVGGFLGYFYFEVLFHKARAQNSLRYVLIIFCFVVVFYFFLITIPTIRSGEFPNYDNVIKFILVCLLGLLSGHTYIQYHTKTNKFS